MIGVKALLEAELALLNPLSELVNKVTFPKSIAKESGNYTTTPAVKKETKSKSA